MKNNKLKYFVKSSVLFLFIFSNASLFAQVKPIREQKQFGFYLQIFGPTSVGINVDYHLINQVDIDFGIGVLGSFQYGIKYHPFGNKNNISFSPFIGFYGENINEFRMMGEVRRRTTGFYVPVGLEWYFSDGLTLLIEFGYNKTHDDFNQTATSKIGGAFRFGYHL